MNAAHEVEATHSPKFGNGEFARTYLLAGNAHLTVRSQRTGTRFTFHIKQVVNDDGSLSPHFVSVLVGANNERDYSFIGTIFGESTFRYSAKSKITMNATSVKAFMWVWSHLSIGNLPPNCEIHHEGRCGSCGRLLTTPESIERGLGPICSDKHS